MPLPNSYTFKTGAIPDYFKAILNAEAPDRFSVKFLEKLEFKSTNDRLFIGILKDLGFLDADGIPKPRYYEFLDRQRSKYVLADAIREDYADLFNVRKDAQTMTVDEVKNKLRTLYAGSRKDSVISYIARTFVALCAEADFTVPKSGDEIKKRVEKLPADKSNSTNGEPLRTTAGGKLILDALQYHINIVLPESRDQAVYDAIFKSLRDHLG